MTTLETAALKRPIEALEAFEIAKPKRFKVSELPLSSSQKSAIDGLVHTIKKSGIYDKRRHHIIAQYNESVRLPRLEYADA